MPVSAKRKVDSFESTRRPSKKPKQAPTPLQIAKRKLQDVIERDPDQRVYQLDTYSRWNDKTFVRFDVGTAETVTRQYLRDTPIHMNLQEYISGNSRCPLILDIEWYNPTVTTHDELFAIMSDLVDVIVVFVNTAMVRDDGRRLERDDVCVEQACTTDGFKASFHVKIFELVFDDMARGMRSFVHYLCAWMYENRYGACCMIPDLFYCQTPFAQTMIREYLYGDVGTLMNDVREKCEEYWEDNPSKRYESCGIDHAIYSRGRAIRVAGSCKPNKPGEIPRFLRPCLVTGWWSGKIDDKYITDEMLREPVPSAECRREWARASLLAVPAPEDANVTVPLLKELERSRTSYDDGPDCLPPPSTERSDGERWRWVLDTDGLVARENDGRREVSSAGGRTMTETGYSVRVNPSRKLADVGERDDDEIEFVYILRPEGNVKRYERREPARPWLDAEDDSPYPAAETFARDASRKVPDRFARYRNARIDARLRKLDILSSDSDAGADCEDRDLQRTRLEAYRRVDEYVVVRYITDRTRRMMFGGAGVVLDPEFELMTARREVMKLRDVERKTAIFCPVHEIDTAFYLHRPSAFVGFDTLGRRFVYCEKCGGRGNSMKEAWGDDESEETWDHLRDRYGQGRVRKIHERYLELEDLIWMRRRGREGEPDGAEDRDVDPVQPANNGPIFYVVQSGMGSGKTSSLKDLTDERLDVIMRRLGLHFMHRTTIVGISPRRELGMFTANELQLARYTDHDGDDGSGMDRNEWLCAQDRLLICINSLWRLADRARGYDVVIIDEYATMVMSMVSGLMLENLHRIVETFGYILQNSRVVIMLAADGTPRMVKTLLPRPLVDWEDPANLRVTVNEGGEGGIRGHSVYVSDKLAEVYGYLKMLVMEGRSVYVPTNHIRFTKNVKEFCETYLGVPDEEIFIYHGESDPDLKKVIIECPEKTLGYQCLYPRCDGIPRVIYGTTRVCDKCGRGEVPERRAGNMCLLCDGNVQPFDAGMLCCDVCGEVMEKPKARVRVFITSPAFGVGFSVKTGTFDTAVGFFYTIPSTLHGNVQHIARVRGYKCRQMVVYVEPPHRKKSGDGSGRAGTKGRKGRKLKSDFEKAVRSHDDMIRSVDPDTFDGLPTELKEFAIYHEYEKRVAEEHGDIMFIEMVGSKTGVETEPLVALLRGNGPGSVVVLPDLSEDELRILNKRKKKKIGENDDGNDDDDDDADDDARLPKRWNDMFDLWLRYARRQHVSPSEADMVKFFELLPVPCGLLRAHEREASFVKRLDCLWRVMEVMAGASDPNASSDIDLDEVDDADAEVDREDGTSALLDIDFRRYERSHGVSFVYRDQRELQQYRMYDTWARVLVPCLIDEHDDDTAADNGVYVFSYLIERCLSIQDGKTFTVKLYPDRVDFNDAVSDIEKAVNEPWARDAFTDKWILTSEVEKILTESDEKICAAYATVVRRGFRCFIGSRNVGVEKDKKNRFVKVTVTDLRRMILLACVRRIGMECNHVGSFNRTMFSVLDGFRRCPGLIDVIPSDDEIALACGMDL